MVSFLQSLFLLFHFCVVFSQLSELVWKLTEEISLQLASKRFSSFGSPANGNKSNAKNSRFLLNRNLTGIIYYCFVILRSLTVALKSAKHDTNGFFKVLLLSSHLLISRHPVQKSTFGACAVTGYCSLNSALSRENLTAPAANILLFLYCGLDFWTWLKCADDSGIRLPFNYNR